MATVRTPEIIPAGVALPLFPLSLEHGLGANYASPNCIARTAIFSTQIYRGATKRPAITQETLLFSLHTLEVYQTSGHRLDKKDEDVLLELLRRAIQDAKQGAEQIWVFFNLEELMTSMGWATGGDTREKLLECLNRLKTASFKIKIPGTETYSHSSFILKSVNFGREGRVPGNPRANYKAMLDLDLPKLFGMDSWTLISGRERRALGGDPIAKMLHSYFSGQSAGWWVAYTDLKILADRHEIIDSKTGEVLRNGQVENRWLDALIAAAEKVSKATTWKFSFNHKMGRLTLIGKKGKTAVPAHSKQPGKPKKTKAAASQLEQTASEPKNAPRTFFPEERIVETLGDICDDDTLDTGEKRQQCLTYIIEGWAWEAYERVIRHGGDDEQGMHAKARETELLEAHPRIKEFRRNSVHPKFDI